MQRREVLKLIAGLVAAGVVPAAWAEEWNKAAFEMKTLKDAMRALGAESPGASDAVLIRAPDIAENGAVVPISIEVKAPNVQSISLLVEKNPQPLAASFTVPPGTEPSVATRVKMGESSDVYALVRADGKYLVAKKEIKITLGGCGG